MEVWKDQLLLTQGSWENVQNAAESVRSQLIQRLIDRRAVPCELGLKYWSAVPASGGSTLLFYIQHAPAWIASGLTNAVTVDFNGHKTVFASIRSRWHAVRSQKITHAGVMPFLVGKYRVLRAFGSHWAQSISQKHTAALLDEQRATAELIGRLVCAKQTGKSPAEFVQHLARVNGVPTSAGGSLERDSHVTTKSGDPEESLQLLQTILDHATSTNDLSSQIPSRVTRWWPLALVSLVGLWKLTGSWSLLVNWIQTSVVETVQDFYNNWIIDPLLKIYKTIRHDPTQNVALVAKESLVSDTTSLENMVVDFARDTDPSLTAADLQALRTRAAAGDLTPVMAVYEKQIGSPMVNLVTGKLVRTLLIQVQKGKVDLEVALSGIDQLLQSQQLVFGLVAAIPAIGVVWWLTRVLLGQIYRQLYGSQAALAESERRHVITALSNLDVVVQRAPAELRDEDVGLIFIHVTMIRRSLRSKTLGSQQLNKVLDRLLNHAIERKTSAVLGDLDRAYMRYQLR